VQESDQSIVSISSWVYIQRPLQEVLKAVAKAGYRHVEIFGDEGHFDLRLPIDLLEVRKLLDDLGLNMESIHAPFSNVNIASLNRTERRKGLQLIEKSIEVCSQMRGRVVVIHPHPDDLLGNRIDYAEMRARMKESLYELANFARKLEIKVAIENLPEFCLEGWKLGSRISELTQLLEEIEHDNLGLCLDTGHALLKKGEINVAQDVVRCEKYLFVIHISDNDGRDDHHWLPGEGIINWPEFLKTLKSINYKGIYTLEISGQGRSEKLLRKSVVVLKDTLGLQPG
jgi:sugar phosphate isomerase/epimerase